MFRSPLLIFSSPNLSEPPPSFISVSINQLDKTDVLLIPEVYIYLVGIHCLVSLCDGLAGYAILLYNALAVQKSPAGSHPPEPGWPALLAVLSFLLTANLSNLLCGDVSGATLS